MSHDYIGVHGPSNHGQTSGQRARKRTTANMDFRGAVRASGAIAVAVAVAVALAIDFHGRTSCERITIKKMDQSKKVRRLPAIYSGHHTRRDGGCSRTAAQGAAWDRWQPVSRPALTGGTVLNPLAPGTRAAGA